MMAIMTELLQDEYSLDTAQSGENCLQIVEESRPDLVLLDVNMPRMDGLETCRRLKSSSDTADIPIIFVSALASRTELMAGYEAGADDYLTKPLNEEVLSRKINLVLASQSRKQELKTISDQAVEDLIDNLSSTEQLKMVVKFLSRCQANRDLSELTANLFDCLRILDLECSLLIAENTETHVYFSDEIDRPMERQILESLRDQDRVVKFGTRLAINSDNASLLVRNLPIDTDSAKELCDNLLILFEGLDARINDLTARQKLLQRYQLLTTVLIAARDNLAAVSDSNSNQKTTVSEVLAGMTAEIKTQLNDFKLGQSQQTKMLNRVAASVREIELFEVENEKIDHKLSQTIHDFSLAMKNSPGTS